MMKAEQIIMLIVLLGFVSMFSSAFGACLMIENYIGANILAVFNFFIWLILIKIYEVKE